jgi:urease accessory protein
MQMPSSARDRDPTEKDSHPHCGGKLQLLLQLADSAFPTGGFAHSGGLESMVQLGLLRDVQALERFAMLQLEQSCSFALPFVRDAWLDPDRCNALDDCCDAMLSNPVANRASRAQGRALLLAADHAFGIRPPRGGFCHLAPVSGLLFQALEIGLNESLQTHVYQGIRACVSAAVRLGVCGPLQAQSIQWRVLSGAVSSIERHAHLRSEDAFQSAPLLELSQGLHDRLYSRLFQT